MQEFSDVCERAARAGGQVLLDWQGRFKVRQKAPKDLVTEADLNSQRVIRKILLDAFPTHDFLGEEDWADDSPETAATGHPTSGFRWIVDPLDGTTNYVHQLHGFSVSVALEGDGELLVAAVYDPISKECFTATRGEGSFLNGKRISVSDCEEIPQALVGSSFSARVERKSPEVARFIEVLLVCQALRRLGSAALNLSYLAAGRLDGYWATSVKSWDVAAGVLLVREAGGVVTGLDGGPLELNHPRFVAASTSVLHEELLRTLGAASK